MQFARNITLQLLRAYKWAISPMLPHACRYVPTCSEYAMEAVERHGALRGLWMAMGRVLRCHPFAGSGYDPVVESSIMQAPSCEAMTLGAMTRSADTKHLSSGPCAPRT
jgi:uncharacterized protein